MHSSAWLCANLLQEQAGMLSTGHSIHPRCTSLAQQALGGRIQHFLQHFSASKAKQLATAAADSMAELHSSVPHEQLLQALRLAVPTLTTDSYKGQSGKVGVMGGCREYTGAPFFAAMSALRMGADLAYVFCAPSAAAVIKGYSPELIVIPALRESHEFPTPDQEKNLDDVIDKVLATCQADLKKWLSRLSVLVIGPGLGEDKLVGSIMFAAVEAARELQLPLVIDGSGLNFIAQWPEAVKGYQHCLLTPNIAEFGRLAAAVGVELPGRIGVQWQHKSQELAAALAGPVLVSKGPRDVITDGQQVLLVTEDGSPRRCGGQGDVLTGTTSAFISWIVAQQNQQRKQQQQQPPERDESAAAAAGPLLPPLMLAAYGGCLTMRAAAALTFASKGRSMVAEDMIEQLGDRVLLHAKLLQTTRL